MKRRQLKRLARAGTAPLGPRQLEGASRAELRELLTSLERSYNAELEWHRAEGRRLRRRSRALSAYCLGVGVALGSAFAGGLFER